MEHQNTPTTGETPQNEANNTPNTTETHQTLSEEGKQQNDPKTDAKDAEIARLQEEVARLGKNLGKIHEEKKKAEEEEAKKRGEFEKLYNESKSTLETLTADSENQKKRLETYDGYFKAQYDARIASLDADKKAVIEKLLDGKSDFEKFSLLDETLAIIAPNTPNNFGRVPEGGQSAGKSSNEGKVQELLKAGKFREALKLRNQE